MGKRRTGRNLAEAEHLAQFPPRSDQRHDPSLVGAQELAQHEQGEQLRLRVVAP
jgi:hypothetical protein